MDHRQQQQQPSSSNTMNHRQQHQQRPSQKYVEALTEPNLCLNKTCGSYGSQLTRKLCSSLCFKKHEENVAFLNFKKRILQSANSTINTNLYRNNATSVFSSASDEDKIVDKSHLKKVAFRCHLCSKRLTICSVFKCRCGEQFCSLHRYSDQHDCTFDYKSAAKVAIAKSNPLIIADKLHYRI